MLDHTTIRDLRFLLPYLRPFGLPIGLACVLTAIAAVRRLSRECAVLLITHHRGAIGAA